MFGSSSYSAWMNQLAKPATVLLGHLSKVGLNLDYVRCATCGAHNGIGNASVSRAAIPCKGKKCRTLLPMIPQFANLLSSERPPKELAITVVIEHWIHARCDCGGFSAPCWEIYLDHSTLKEQDRRTIADVHKRVHAYINDTPIPDTLTSTLDSLIFDTCVTTILGPVTDPDSTAVRIQADKFRQERRKREGKKLPFADFLCTYHVQTRIDELVTFDLRDFYEAFGMDIDSDANGNVHVLKQKTLSDGLLQMLISLNSDHIVWIPGKEPNDNDMVERFMEIMSQLDADLAKKCDVYFFKGVCDRLDNKCCHEDVTEKAIGELKFQERLFRTRMSGRLSRVLPTMANVGKRDEFGFGYTFEESDIEFLKWYLSHGDEYHEFTNCYECEFNAIRAINLQTGKPDLSRDQRVVCDRCHSSFETDDRQYLISKQSSDNFTQDKSNGREALIVCEKCKRSMFCCTKHPPGSETRCKPYPIPTFEEVAYEMQLRGIHFVDWDSNRGEPPVNSPYLVNKVVMGYLFWMQSLKMMCDDIENVVRSSRHTNDETGVTYQGKSFHFSARWGEGSPFAFILGVPDPDPDQDLVSEQDPDQDPEHCYDYCDCCKATTEEVGEIVEIFGDGKTQHFCTKCLKGNTEAIDCVNELSHSSPSSPSLDADEKMLQVALARSLEESITMRCDACGEACALCERTDSDGTTSFLCASCNAKYHASSKTIG
jgi:hypothetical protein